MLAESLIAYGQHPQFTEDPTHCAESMLAVVASLWENRHEVKRLRAALERNTQEVHRYKHTEPGHHCGWRVIAEAMIARSREALQEGE